LGAIPQMAAFTDSLAAWLNATSELKLTGPSWGAWV